MYVYVGLSGALYGVLAFGLLRVKDYQFWIRVLVFSGLVLKVLFEYFAGASDQISEFIGGPVATDVHLYGVVMGVLSVVVMRLWRL